MLRAVFWARKSHDSLTVTSLSPVRRRQPTSLVADAVPRARCEETEALEHSDCRRVWSIRTSVTKLNECHLLECESHEIAPALVPQEHSHRHSVKRHKSSETILATKHEHFCPRRTALNFSASIQTQVRCVSPVAFALTLPMSLLFLTSRNQCSLVVKQSSSVFVQY